MKKTPLMLRVEGLIGESIEIFLPKIFENGWKSSYDLSLQLNIHRATLGRWLKKLGLEKENKRPSREELDYSYNVARKPVRKSAREIGVNPKTYYRWLEDACIERRQDSEAYLPKGFTRPSRDELERLLAEKTGIEAAVIYGINPRTLRTWKQKAGIYKFRGGKYDNLSLRVEMLSALCRDSGKKIEELNSEYFKNIKQPNGKSYRGLLNWYLVRFAHIFPVAKISMINDYKINSKKS